MIKEVKKLWGSEEWLVNNNLYCAKYLNLKRGYQCSLHYHKLKDETFYILEGIIELELQENGREVTITLVRGNQYRLKPYTLHRFRAITFRAKILEISTTHFDSDSYRKEKARKIKG